jgi:hypothetical protein
LYPSASPQSGSVHARGSSRVFSAPSGRHGDCLSSSVAVPPLQATLAWTFGTPVWSRNVAAILPTSLFDASSSALSKSSALAFFHAFALR